MNVNVPLPVPLLLALSAGCYAHDISAIRAREVAARPPLIRPMKGRYAITRGDAAVGEETFTITSSRAIWRVEGRIAIAQQVEETQHYVLEIDERTREPIAFEVEMSLAGEHQQARGRRTEDNYFAIDATTIAGAWSRKVAYGAGTAIDLGSTPLASTLVLSLLGPTLELRKPISVRTIVITHPQLEPAVMIITYELHARDESTRASKIAVAPLGAKRPTAMWVRPDGLPTRVRIFVEDGAPYELRLESEH